MIATYDDTQFDPITNRDIASPCWDGRHAEGKGVDNRSSHDRDKCGHTDCQCMCHDSHALQLSAL